jgi:hypothetical protein
MIKRRSIMAQRAPQPTGFAGILTLIGQAFTVPFTALGDAHRRLNEYETLNRCADSQLAEMGLARGDLPRHVFRDLLDQAPTNR